MTRNTLERANAIAKELEMLNKYEPAVDKIIAIEYKSGKYYPLLSVSAEMALQIEKVIFDRIAFLRNELAKL